MVYFGWDILDNQEDKHLLKFYMEKSILQDDCLTLFTQQIMSIKYLSSI